MNKNIKQNKYFYLYQNSSWYTSYSATRFPFSIASGFGAAPVCSETFTMAEDPKASAVGEKEFKR